MFLQSKSDFEALFKAHYAALVRYGQGVLKDRNQAEDVVQQMFLNLWENREGLEIKGNAFSYLMRAVHNACLNVIKHQSVVTRHADYALNHAESESIESAIEQEEFNARVKSAVQKLPPQCKRVFLMSRLHQKKYAEIAGELDISIKTVENQMGKALRILRGELADEINTTMHIIKSIFWIGIGVKLTSIVIL